MPSDPHDKHRERETFFQRMQRFPRGFFRVQSNQIAGDASEQAYPIQLELQNIKERYELLEEIGQGGMKWVARVYDRKLGKALALAKPLSADGPEAIEAFLREARLSSKLEHPNIITVYEIGIDESNMPFFTMDLLDGKSLQEAIEQNWYSQEQLMDIFFKICDAVDYSHSNDVLHLDLKPQNIQLGEFGEVYLCDWGLARVATVTEAQTRTVELDADALNHATLFGNIKGSLGFMAPEQAQKGGDKDVRTDVYGLGAILYAILNGHSPIASSDPEKMLDDTLAGKIVPVSEGSNVPTRLQSVAVKSLSLDPEARYQSVRALKEDLENYFGGFATIAEDASILTHLQLLYSRHRRKIMASVLAMSVLSVIGILGVREINTERKKAILARDIAQTESVRAESNYRKLLTEQKLTAELANNARELTLQIASDSSFEFPREKIAILTRGLALEENTRNQMLIREALVYLHFITQNFEKAIELIESLENDGLRDIFAASKYGIEAKLQGGELRHDDAARILFTILRKKWGPLINAFYVNHIETRVDSEILGDSPLLLTSLMLNTTNNFWEPNYSQRKTLRLERGELKIMPPGYSRFLLGSFNLLSLIEFDALDLSNTSFYEFDQLRGLKFKKINLTGCEHNRVRMYPVRILKNAGVDEFIYDARRLSPGEVALIEEHFGVKEGIVPENSIGR